MTLILTLLLASSIGFASGDFVVKHQTYAFENKLEEERDWRAPDYTKSKQTLGWKKSSFETPKGLEESVAFWVRIYSEVSTQEGLIHDSRFPHLVYEGIDFRPIMKSEDLTDRQKTKAKRKLVKDKKKYYADIMKRLSKLKNGEELEGDEKRIWDLFQRVDEPSKFIKASRKGRLRFQLGQSDRFLKGIFFSGRYIEKMEKIFEEAGLPIELTRLPFVESSFNLAARSKVGASGIWQFMRSTGKQYMRVNALVDERNDPISATKAATKLLRYNYKKLGNWPLAVTAYNYGPSGLRRLVRKYKTNDLVKIIEINRTNRFGFASSNFFASFLAAIEVEKNAKEHFKTPKWANALVYDELVLTKPITFKYLAKFFPDAESAGFFNPHLSRQVRRGHFAIPKRTRVRITRGHLEKFLDGLKSEAVQLKTAMMKYKVNRGDTLGHIAQDFGVSIRSLRDVNSIRNPRRLRAGQILLIPKPSR